MITIENISYSYVSGQRQFSIDVFDNGTHMCTTIELPAGVCDKSTIINLLIRSRYTQDQVEAIINNHFLNLSDWLDDKLSGKEVDFIDTEYQEFQEWRAVSKKLAVEIIEKIASIK